MNPATTNNEQISNNQASQQPQQPQQQPQQQQQSSDNVDVIMNEGEQSVPTPTEKVDKEKDMAELLITMDNYTPIVMCDQLSNLHVHHSNRSLYRYPTQ